MIRNSLFNVAKAFCKCYRKIDKKIFALKKWISFFVIKYIIKEYKLKIIKKKVLRVINIPIKHHCSLINYRLNSYINNYTMRI